MIAVGNIENAGEAALALMNHALALLDSLDQSIAAAHLQHAIDVLKKSLDGEGVLTSPS